MIRPEYKLCWTAEGFREQFEYYLMTSASHQDAYWLAEYDHFDLYGLFKYSSYESFSTARYRVINKKG